MQNQEKVAPVATVPEMEQIFVVLWAVAKMLTLFCGSKEHSNFFTLFVAQGPQPNLWHFFAAQRSVVELLTFFIAWRATNLLILFCSPGEIFDFFWGLKVRVETFDHFLQAEGPWQNIWPSLGGKGLRWNIWPCFACQMVAVKYLIIFCGPNGRG